MGSHLCCKNYWSKIKEWLNNAKFTLINLLILNAYTTIVFTKNCISHFFLPWPSRKYKPQRWLLAWRNHFTGPTRWIHPVDSPKLPLLSFGIVHYLTGASVKFCTGTQEACCYISWFFSVYILKAPARLIIYWALLQHRQGKFSSENSSASVPSMKAVIMLSYVQRTVVPKKQPLS